MRRLLIVEDNKHKREKVLSFLRESFSDLEIIEAHSYTSGCQKIEGSEFDVVLLDMSLPTRDKTANESGGTFRTFGGRELARKMQRRNIHARIIFLTQYDSFSDTAASHTLESLGDELIQSCGEDFVGLVHYDSSRSTWKDQILKLLAK